jgi:CheY-like chemotaxis protein
MLALVVEDEGGLRVIYRKVLEDLGFQVVEAPDGSTALNHLDTLVPDLIFLDMLLPNINGVTVLNHIVTDPRMLHTRIIIVSSNKQFEKIIGNNPMITFVLKPIRPAQIRELATATLQH